MTSDLSQKTRLTLYWILIAVGLGAMLGRILAVDSVDRVELEKVRVKEVPEKLKARREELVRKGLNEAEIAKELERIEAALRREALICRPFLSGNDRSRWCSLRALVEPEMRVEGAPYAIDKVIQQPNWDTIDMVKHDRCYERPEGPEPQYQRGERIKNWDGKQVGGHVYSSKPPLLPTMLAGPYWAIYRLTGATLGTHPYFVGRILLVLVNVLPMLVYFWLLTRLAERFGATDWGRLFAVAAGVFGTFLTTFAVVLNNHLPAAVCAIVVLYSAVRIWFDGQRRLRYFAAAGFFAAMLVANELPALALAALLALGLLWKAPRQTLLAFVPAAAVVVAAFFGTNWIAHRTLRPAYGHRTGADTWYDYTYIRNGRVIESYWKDPVGVDRGQPSPANYALHVLVGHHGVFSLTPVWLLTVLGVGIWLVRPGASQPLERPRPRGEGDEPQGKAAERRGGGPRPNAPAKGETTGSSRPADAPAAGGSLRTLAAAIAAVSLVVLGFYLAQPLENRNYGGVAAGLRWMFWFAPLWLVGLLPAADLLSRRAWTRWLGLLLLALSALSVSYPTWNPWIAPWLVEYMGP